MRVHCDFAFKPGIDFGEDGSAIEVRCSAQIDKKVATVWKLITRDTASDLRDLRAGRTQTFIRVELYRGQSRDIACRFVDRVLAKMRMGRVSRSAVRGTPQN